MADDDRVRQALEGLGADPEPLLDPPAGLWERVAAETIGLEERPDVVVPMARHRSRPRSRRWLVAAAAAMVALVGVVSIAVLRAGDDPRGGEVVAVTDLEALQGDGRGTAELAAVDGGQQLRVQVEGLAPTEGFYEVWLLTPEVDGLVSLGPLREDGTYVVPEGVDPTELPVVDVSDEPLDGDPSHSSVSVLRGTLA